MIDARLVAVEHDNGIVLPPSYKEFMRSYDGWPFVFRGSSLLGSTELVAPEREARKAAALDELGTPLPSFVAPMSTQWRDNQVLLIGVDERADVVLVFDVEAPDAHGEMEVVSWIAGLGMRHASFGELLEFLADLTEASTCPAVPARAA